jgi:hypothetical protein
LLNERIYKNTETDNIISVLHCRQLETELLYRSREANKVLSRGNPNPGEKDPFPNPQSPPCPLFPVPRPKRTDTTEIKISRKKAAQKNKSKKAKAVGKTPCGRIPDLLHSRFSNAIFS